MLIRTDKPGWDISHGLHGLGGLGGLLEIEDYGMGGLGMTAEEARVMLATGNGTADQLKAANAAYYGPPTVTLVPTGNSVVPNIPVISGGYYQAEASVQAANPINNPVYPGNAEVAPDLYAINSCSPSDSACVAKNNQIEQANIILTNNARNAYDAAIASYNHALNVAQTGNAKLPDPNAHYTQQAVPVISGASLVDSIVQGGQAIAAVVGQVVSQVIPTYQTPAQVQTAIARQAAGQTSSEVVPTNSTGTTAGNTVTQNGSSPNYSQNGSAGAQIMQAVQGLAQTGNASGTTTLTWSDIWTQYEWWIIAALGVGGYLAFSGVTKGRGRG